MSIIEAKYYDILNDGQIRCTLCSHNCILNEGQIGLCNVRYNKNGKLYTEIYGRITAMAIDPIEKKPLYHFYPSKNIFSVSTYGCNMKCPYCQNYHISFEKSDYREIMPDELVNMVKDSGTNMIAFTYNEPLIWFEYMVDVFPLLKKENIQIVLVTNGMINSQPLKELLPYIDAVNIDIKSGNKKIYNNKLMGDMDTVYKNIKKIFNNSVHVELTHLLVTEFYNKNDFNYIVNFIASVSSDIPFHISKYFPYYKHAGMPTPNNILKEAYEIAKEKLKYVYIGNTQIVPANTYCPHCNALLIERRGYQTVSHIDNPFCFNCHEKLYFVF